MEVPQKTKNRVALWFRNPTPRHIAGQNYNLKRYTHTRLVIAILFTIAKTWKQPKCPSTDKCVKKMWCAHVHTHQGVLPSINMKRCHLSNMAGSHQVKSARKRKTNTIWCHFYWNLNYDTNELPYATDAEQRTDWWLLREWKRNGVRVWG